MSRWVVIRATSSKAIIHCLDAHFTRHRQRWQLNIVTGHVFGQGPMVKWKGEAGLLVSVKAAHAEEGIGAES